MAITGPGFVADHLAEATAGVYGGPAFYELGEAIIPSELSEQSLLESAFGIDLVHDGDLQVNGAGDFRLTGGLEGWRAALLRSFVTRPGEIFWHPEFGIGLQDFLNLPASADNINEIKRRIRSSLSTNETVEDLVALDVVVNRDVSQIDIHLAVAVAGQTRPASFQIRSV